MVVLIVVAAGIADGTLTKLSLFEQVFFLMPLMHAEDKAVANESVDQFAALITRAPEEDQAQFTNFHKFAIKHQVIIERFGHYPHRNKILGRPSTEEEIQFLTEPDSSF